MAKLVNIDPEIHKQLKVEAAKQEVKMSELADRILRQGLQNIREN